MNRATEKKKILLFEFGRGGHSLVYLTKIASVALEVADKTGVASSINKEMLSLSDDTSPQFSSIKFMDPGTLWERRRVISGRLEESLYGALTGFSILRQLKREDWNDWRLFFTNFPPSRALFIRGFLSVLKFDWGAFLVNAPFLRNPSADRRVESLLSLKRCKSIFTLDEDRVGWIESRFPQARTTWLPDFAQLTWKDGAVAKAIREKARGRPVVLLIGRISERKGLSLYLKLSRNVSFQNVLFALVGKCELQGLSPQLRKEVVEDFQLQENAFFYGEEIDSEEEYNQVIKISSIVWLIYPGFTNSSNTLTKAGSFNVPCVALSDSLIGERVAKYALGSVVPDPSYESVERILIQALEDRKVLLENPDSKSIKFVNDFSEGAFVGNLSHGLRGFWEEN